MSQQRASNRSYIAGPACAGQYAGEFASFQIWTSWINGIRFVTVRRKPQYCACSGSLTGAYGAVL